MSTARITPAAIVILSIILSLLIVSVSAKTPGQNSPVRYRYRYRYGGRGHHRRSSGSGDSTRYYRSPGARRYKRNQRAKQAHEFLDAHNTMRAAKGQPQLTWDKGLARTARRWATKRTNDCEMIHSQGPYGENLFWGGQDHWTPTEVVQSWAKEESFFDANTNECMPGQMCGHYTQIVWGKTTKVGCARQNCNGGGLYVVCNYDPPGNYINEHPFGGSPPPSDGDSPFPPPSLFN